jgi:hypothetical protein
MLTTLRQLRARTALRRPIVERDHHARGSSPLMLLPRDQLPDGSASVAFGQFVACCQLLIFSVRQNGGEWCRAGFCSAPVSRFVSCTGVVRVSPIVGVEVEMSAAVGRHRCVRVLPL